MGLTYQSQNCSGNKWWREIARPVKRLIRRRELLKARKQTPEVLAKLEKIEEAIMILRERGKSKSSARRNQSQAGGVRRTYRDLDPILASLPC
jgi:hypothetical protein